MTAKEGDDEDEDDDDDDDDDRDRGGDDDSFGVDDDRSLELGVVRIFPARNSLPRFTIHSSECSSTICGRLFLPP